MERESNKHEIVDEIKQWMWQRIEGIGGHYEQSHYKVELLKIFKQSRTLYDPIHGDGITDVFVDRYPEQMSRSEYKELLKRVVQLWQD